LMALIRQFGCPTAFLTLSCAEYDWVKLLQEITETVYRRKFSKEEMDDMSEKEKRKLISDNVVMSMMSMSMINKRIKKLFALMKYDFFEDKNVSYHVSAFFFRVEFQQRGSPHVHSVIWLKDKDGKEAPSYYTSDNDIEDEEMEIRGKK